MFAYVCIVNTVINIAKKRDVYKQIMISVSFTHLQDALLVVWRMDLEYTIVIH